ncbi:hypothetical protein MMC10_003581 [Thelotrema lepadinum]|nr:hypothetical protein [Thelotrema lepadinum]
MLAAPPFNILAKFDQVDDAIDTNAEIATSILHTGLEAFGVSPEPSSGEPDWRDTAKAADLEKVNTILRQFCRDWSEEGAPERTAHYRPVLDDLDRLYKDVSDKGEIRVLVPGAGLGRLVFEVCRAGYHTEGNEISFHALLASNWVLNTLKPGEKFDFYPAALRFSNHLSRDDQLRKIQIPDVHPGAELDLASQGRRKHAFERLGMSAADFTVTYSDEQHRGQFDAVATVFFIDTAPNVIRYIEAIHHTIREGGYWINLGPLLWHFEARHDVHPKHTDKEEASSAAKGKVGIEEPGSVELTNEEILLLVKHMGFEVEAFEVRSDCQGYIQDPPSMVRNSYRVSHFVARKVAAKKEQSKVVVV